VKKTLDTYSKSFVYLTMINKGKTMKKNKMVNKPKKLKKHTSTKDVGFGTKKMSLDEMKMDNVMFDTLNDGFINDFDGMDSELDELLEDF